MTKGADYCGIVDKVCEHRFNMQTNVCIECRTMFLIAMMEDLKKEIRRNGK